MPNSDSSTDQKPRPGKYVMPRSRYLSTVTCVTRNQPASVAPRRTIRRTDQNALKPPAIRPTHETVVAITPTTSNAPHRQSSPKLDISTDIARLVINDSVASAVFPACNHRVDPRRRSMSADSVRVSGPIPSSVTAHDQTNYVNDLERPTTDYESPATHVILNVIKKRLDTLLEQQTRHNLQEIETVLNEIRGEREHLLAIQCRQLKWAHWLEACQSLCAENEALKTIQIALFGSSTGGAQSRSFLERFDKFITGRIYPVLDRLPVRNMHVPRELDLTNIIQTAKLFSAASEQELVQLETLADLAERLLDHLRDTYIPQAEAQSELIHRAVGLLAYEASLRFEQIQRQWLADYQQRSTL